MKLRILRNIVTPSGTFRAGNVVVIPGSKAEDLIKSGSARVENGTPWVPGAEPKPEPKSKAKPKAKAGRTVRQIREARAAASAAKPKTQIEPDPVPVEGSAVVSESE